ncbi:cellulose-binding protein [Streptomyces sp. NPDC059248]|uniref:cellulose-binding protein n=1 Tax=Streptomyces sp. NPDC059248 TaxID=3346791 RepID=UPI0036D01C30
MTDDEGAREMTTAAAAEPSSFGPDPDPSCEVLCDPEHGFDVVRRGYRADQVHDHLAAVSRERDEAWERAARLTVLAREMTAEAARLREAVEGLGPQTYESLGAPARELLAAVWETADHIRTTARDEARSGAEAAETAARRLAEESGAAAGAALAEAEDHTRRLVTAARIAGGRLLMDARRDAGAYRAEATVVWDGMRRRAEDLLAALESEQAQRWAEVEREAERRSAAADDLRAGGEGRAEALLRQAEREFADAEEHARRTDEAAGARAEALLRAAAEEAEGVARETDRVLTHHASARAEALEPLKLLHDSLSPPAGSPPAEAPRGRPDNPGGPLAP